MIGEVEATSIAETMIRLLPTFPTHQSVRVVPGSQCSHAPGEVAHAHVASFKYHRHVIICLLEPDWNGEPVVRASSIAHELVHFLPGRMNHGRRFDQDVESLLRRYREICP